MHELLKILMCLYRHFNSYLLFMLCIYSTYVVFSSQSNSQR